MKEPVARPWVIMPTGAAGDEVAAHSDHLYAFDRAGYDHWAAELGVGRDTWSDGWFAENLTLDTMDQSELRVGDHYRVGEAVLVVTGPRVPCWKLTWRLGQPKSFMRQFRLSGRSGAYFGVVEPGVVEAGDEFTLIGREGGAPTVAELARLCDSGTRITTEERAVIDRALASPHLSPTARGALTLKVANLERDASASAAGWRGWRRFEIDGAVAETAEATSYLLRPAGGGALPAFRAGQHVVVRLSEPGAEPVVRTWSLSSYARDPSRYRITVRRRPGGRGGAALSRAPASGLTVELRAPAGEFRLDRGAFRPVVLVAAGIGITPMIAMIQAHLDRDGHRPPLWLLYGTPGPGRAAFRDYLDDLFPRHDDLHLHYFHSRTSKAEPGAATVHRGRITAPRVVDVLRGNYLRTADGPAAIPWFESDIYVCGSAEFTAAVRGGLIEAGANPDLVRAEDFAAAATPTLPSRQQDATVRFGPNGPKLTWVAQSERSLLELAEDHGLELPYDCRAGSCRTCESRLVCGDVDGAVTTTPDGARRVLLCVSYPRSDHVEVEAP
ncbi:MOSC domain-containing protein [Jiangella anatolica]|uniref:Sulfurase n=1 Tax=Jiangella anatolica TaxID=2670374 RepID=A0A2W2BGK5_9ACTN|nr:MOSC domain-containing protein [Jiangella anatolica]PZF86325.1 hypothetical protein C1I92_02215 [Jiangella anatolica]